MKPRVIRDKRSNLDKLRKDLDGLDRKFVVAGLVGAAQSTGAAVSDEVIKYASVQEFGAVIKPRSFNVTTHKKIRKSALTRSAFDKYGKKRKTHLKKGRFVSAKEAMTGKGLYMQETHATSHNGFKIPSRPFLRSWYDTDLQGLVKFAESRVIAVLRGRLTAEQALNAIGLYAQKGIRQRIRTARSWAQPNAKSTIRKKKSSAPLIDKGVMLNSVSFDIRTR